MFQGTQMGAGIAWFRGVGAAGRYYRLVRLTARRAADQSVMDAATSSNWGPHAGVNPRRLDDPSRLPGGDHAPPHFVLS